MRENRGIGKGGLTEDATASIAGSVVLRIGERA